MKNGHYIFDKKEICLLGLGSIVQLSITAYLMSKNYKDGVNDTIYEFLHKEK